MDLRTAARDIFRESLNQLRLEEVMHQRLHTSGTQLHIADHTYNLQHFRHILLIGVGKAAVPMAETLLQILSPLLTAHHTLRGIVVGASLPQHPDPRLQYRIGSHPIPDFASAQAASLVLDALARCDRQTLVFFLVSGGASAMLEGPLHPSLSLADLAAFHQILVHSGLSIAQMNTLRKHLSAVKGGRLAAAAGAATTCTLLVSDVLPSTPEIIGSGPSLPDPSTVEDCRTLLHCLHSAPIPPAIRSWFADPRCPETPKPHDPAFRNASWQVLLSSHDLAEAARQSAIRRGFHVTVDLACDEWDFRAAADHLLAHLRRLASSPRPACLISTGELSVALTGTPGLGGRNQQFALYCARELASWPEPAAVLSAGSDGVDGNSPAAGAVVDNTTLARAAKFGLNIDDALGSFNAYPLFRALGDDLTTGPSGNNLRDLRLLLLKDS